MGELISITTYGQGLSVVSARELYTFLEVKQQFTDWIKNRISKYGFREGEDYTAVSKILDTDQAGSESTEMTTNFSENSEKLPFTGPKGIFHNSMKNSRRGRPDLDYALTLDMAKELSMVERNDKGKQARLYFINAEKALRQLVDQPAHPPTLTAEQVILQQAHALVSQQQQIEQLRTDVASIMNGQLPAPRTRPSAVPVLPTLPGLELPAPHQRPVVRSLRSQINQAIDAYCERHHVTHTDTWRYLYRRLQDVYGINVYRLVRTGQERTIDTLERYGHLDTLSKLIQAELVNQETL